MRKHITINDGYTFDEYISLKRLTMDDTFVAKISGAHIQDERSMFNELSATLQFPGTFTGNWDVFTSYLLDMSWIRQSNYFIAINNFEEIYSDSGCDFEVIQKIKSLLSVSLIQCVKKWRGKMRVYLCDDGDVCQLLPDDGVK